MVTENVTGCSDSHVPKAGVRGTSGPFRGHDRAELQELPHLRLSRTSLQHTHIQPSDSKRHGKVILPTLLLRHSAPVPLFVDHPRPTAPNLSRMGNNYKEIAAIALQRRESAIPKDLLLPEETLRKLPRNLTTVPQSSGHFTATELEIINADAAAILFNIKKRTWTALDVAKAFCKAAVAAQQLVCPAG